jgi:hypothetical protein
VVLHPPKNTRTCERKRIVSHSNQPGVASPLVEANARHLLAQEQVEYAVYNIGLGGGGGVHDIPSSHVS